MKTMLRKVLWSGMLALMTMVARRVSIRVWRLVTGEEPPVRR
jgi:hypothetical protein